MSRRTSGPKIAEVHSAFVFPCRVCNHQVIRTLESNDKLSVGTTETIDCPNCKHHHDSMELLLAQHLGVMCPCNTFECPYCNLFGIIISDQEITRGIAPMFEGEPEPGETLDHLLKHRKVIATLEHESYTWELPKFLVCDGCKKPVKLDTTRCLYIRAREHSPGLPMINDRPKPKAPEPEIEFHLTPKMKSFF